MLRSPDVRFSTVASQESTAEVELGRVASEKSRSPEVKSYGELMIRDHDKAGAELQRLSAGRLTTLPKSLDARGLLVRTKLAGLEGPKFDRAYMKAMVNADKLAIKSYKREVKIGTDPGLKSFAGDTLPVLMSHLDKAKALRALVSAESAQ